MTDRRFHHTARLILALVLAIAAGWLIWGFSPPSRDPVGPPDLAPQRDGPAAAPAPLSPAVEMELDRLLGVMSRGGGIESVRRRIEELRTLHPRSARVEAMLAMTYHREKRYALARPHFERAIQLDPDYAPAYHFLGYALYYLGELDAARTAFENHLARSPAPGEGTTVFGLGLIDLDEGRLDDAERRFREAIRVQQHMPERARDVAAAHARLGDVYARRGDFERAKAELLQAVRIHPDLYGAYFKLHQVHLRLGEEEEAARAFERFREVQARVRPGEEPE